MKKNEARKEFRIPSDLTEVPNTSVQVLKFLKPLGLKEAVFFDIRLCLEEALINAMKYGNEFKKEVPVLLTVEYDAKQVRINIEDKGKGFNVKKIKDCTEKENLARGGGRGVYLIRQLMDKVTYNSKGNRLQMVKVLSEKPKAPRK